MVLELAVILIFILLITKNKMVKSSLKNQKDKFVASEVKKVEKKSKQKDNPSKQSKLVL